MKLTSKKKIIVLTVLLSCVMLLAGWGKKKVELMTDGKLIDLDKAIMIAPPAADKAEQTKDKQSETEAEAQSDKAVTDRSTVPNKIRIRIRGTEVYFDGTKCEVKDISSLIKQKCVAGDEVQLLDDYAEAHVFHDVDDTLTELKETIGFEYHAQ